MTGFDWERSKKRERASRLRRARGDDCPHAKLTEAQVLHLRSGAIQSLHALAKSWGVDRKTLREARNGDTWSHVAFPNPCRELASKATGPRTRAESNATTSPTTPIAEGREHG